MAEAPQDVQEEQKESVALETKTEEERPVATSPKVNGTTTNGTTHDKHHGTSDPDAQEMVIGSLRSQIQDLFSQVSELNGKLVKSYDRVSDLEDDLHVASATLRSSSLKISQLELERTQHLSALNTGLLVEKSHVTQELTRLMEKATEEAAHRGQAESARRDIEKDLDDLSASLFGQANTMVAEARYSKHLSEQKVAEAERALKGAEEAVAGMQQQMQTLQSEKEEAEKASIAKGSSKHLERRGSENLARSIRLLSSHLPYQEFLLFVAHLRSVHPSSPQAPAMTTLIPLPFLARLVTEDSEPTVRLDLAPSLNWLSRRSVLTAIHNGQLIIEPMSSAALLQEANVPGLNSSSTNISCALCGTPIFSTTELNHNHSRPQPPPMGHSNSNSSSWSASLFKKPTHSSTFSISSNHSQSSTPPRSSIQSIQQLSPTQVYIFRLAPQSSGTPSNSLPLPKGTTTTTSSTTTSLYTDSNNSYTSSPSTPQSSTIYPLCANMWCLSRLRSTCTLWAFVRTGIIEKIWEEEVPTLLPAKIATSPVGEKPPVPPRRRGLWGMASALSERATSWGEGDKGKKTPQVPPSPVEHRRLPPLPPSQSTGSPIPAKHAVPPPLPRRSDVRHPSPTVEKSSPESISVPVISQPVLPPRAPRRPITPASVPLPDSRPHTPPVASATPPPNGTGSANGSPVPPPLPRRAAARAPRSLPEGGSPLAIPNGSEVAEPITESKAGDDVQKSPVIVDSPKVDAEQAAPTTTASEELKVDSKETSSDPVTTDASESSTSSSDVKDTVEETESSVTSPTHEEEEFVDAESSLDASVTKIEEKVEEDVVSTPTDTSKQKEERTPTEANAVTTDPITADSAKSLPLGDIEDKVEETKPPSNGSLEESTDEGAKPAVVQDKDAAVVDASKDEEQKPHTNGVLKEKPVDDSEKPDDKEVYIGDTTWEERTWKEIIRLKEEMYWARIGGLRQ